MNCLFKVIRKSTREIVPVYDVKSDKFLEFLVYSRNICEWVYDLAQRFEPIDEGVEWQW